MRFFSQRRTNTWTLALAALALLPAFAGSLAAQSPQDEFGEEIEVNEVLIDVLVTDKQGQVVVGLDEDDFVVREDGEPVELTGVDFYSNREFVGAEATAAEIGVEPGETPVNRYFILFFHRQDRLLPRLGANLMNAGHRAEQWVESELLPNDYVAVASYDFKLNVQDFSNDPEVIVAGIKEAITRRDFTAKEVAAAPDVPSLARNVPEGDADRIYEALAMVSEAAGEVRGRKNLILFSIGFGEVSSFGFYRPDMRYYPEMIRTINDNNVAVYPIDTLALDLSPFLRLNLLDNVLARMAIESGGKLYTTFTNYLTPLEQISEDNSGYYLLTYRARHDASEEGYQKVDVETKNAAFKTRHREGYSYGDDYPYSEAPGGAGR